MQELKEKRELKSEILKEENLNEYKDFLEKHYRRHYAQSKNWANIKSDWKNEIIVVRDEEGKIKGRIKFIN